MRHLTKLERRLAHAEFSTIFPGETSAPGAMGSMQPIQEKELDSFLREVCARVPLQAALGLRLAIWIAALAPLFVLRRFATIRSLSNADRETVITKLLASPSYAVRQLVMVLKTIGALLFAAHPSVRARMVVRVARPISGDHLVSIRLNRSAAA